MSRADFAPELRLALEAYAAPPLPQGFADRLVARALVGAAAAPTGWARRDRSPWRRGTRIVGTIVASSFATALAAAIGLFGEPGRLPVIGPLLAAAPTERVIDPLPRAATATTAPPVIAVEAAPMARIESASPVAVVAPRDLPREPVTAAPARPEQAPPLPPRENLRAIRTSAPPSLSAIPTPQPAVQRAAPAREARTDRAEREPDVEAARTDPAASRTEPIATAPDPAETLRRQRSEATGNGAREQVRLARPQVQPRPDLSRQRRELRRRRQ